MDSPDITAAPQQPPPPSYVSYSYDEDGNPIVDQQQIYDAATNTYKYIPRELTAQEKAERKQISGMRAQALANLNELTNLTEEQKTAKYAEYIKTYKDVAMREFNTLYDKQVQGVDEQANARGMMGSRAYADTMAELNDSKTKRGTEVAQEATLLGRDLYQDDVNRAYGLYSGLDGMTKANDAMALHRQATVGGVYRDLQAAEQARYNSALSAWSTQAQLQNQAAAGSNNFMGSLVNTGVGLGFLFGSGGLASGTRALAGGTRMMAGSFNPVG